MALDIPTIPEEGKLRVLVIFLYAAIFFFIVLFFMGIQTSCLSQGKTTWGCLWQYKWIYLIFWLFGALAFALLLNPILQVVKIYKIKDEYANSLRINSALKNIKLLKELGYYKKDKKEEQKKLRQIIKKFVEPEKDVRNWWQKLWGIR